MRKNVLLFVLSCIIGCHVALAQQVPNVLQQGKADSRECKAWVDERLSGMSLKEKIGQLFIHTVAPLNTPVNKKNIHDAIKEYKVGGLLFSGGQLSNQILLTNYAQELAEVPLFITFDGEWGLAMRLKGTPSFPKNRVLGCIQDNELLYEYGKEVARQCKELGHPAWCVPDTGREPARPEGRWPVRLLPDIPDRRHCDKSRCCPVLRRKTRRIHRAGGLAARACPAAG